MKRRAGTYKLEVRLDKVDCPPRGINMTITLLLDRGQDPHILAKALGRQLVKGDYIVDGPEGYEPGSAILDECAELRTELHQAREELAALKSPSGEPS